MHWRNLKVLGLNLHQVFYGCVYHHIEGTLESKIVIQ